MGSLATADSEGILLQISMAPGFAMSSFTRSGRFLFPLSADSDAGLVSFGLLFVIFASRQAGFRVGGGPATPGASIQDNAILTNYDRWIS
jgi:hypothetical protein